MAEAEAEEEGEDKAEEGMPELVGHRPRRAAGSAASRSSSYGSRSSARSGRSERMEQAVASMAQQIQAMMSGLAQHGIAVQPPAPGPQAVQAFDMAQEDGEEEESATGDEEEEEASGAELVADEVAVDNTAAAAGAAPAAALAWGPSFGEREPGTARLKAAKKTKFVKPLCKRGAKEGTAVPT